jgi:hypothetical protein
VRLGALMESHQYNSGKKVVKKSRSTRKKLPDIIHERVNAINDLLAIVEDKDPKKPTNWYANQEFYGAERQKRLGVLNKQNLTIEDLKLRLVEAEMVIAYESFLSQQLIMLHIEGRKALTNIAEHHAEDVLLRTKGLSNKNADKLEIAKNLILEIGKGSISQNDWGKFRIKASRKGFKTSTIRKYWLKITGFKSTKN